MLIRAPRVPGRGEYAGPRGGEGRGPHTECWQPETGSCCGVDLRRTNMYVCIVDGQGRKCVHRKLRDDLELVLKILEPYLSSINVSAGSAGSSYWLEHGHRRRIGLDEGEYVDCDVIDGMRYECKDRHMRPIGRSVVRGGEITIPAGEPVFVTELTRR